MSGRGAKFWIGGTLVALAGVALARLVAPCFVGKPVLLLSSYFLGVTLGIAGLVIITFGMDKRYQDRVNKNNE